MYTRCTTCRTVFHITVPELRAADGRVVCGQCDEEFDALEHLSDTLPPAEAPESDQEAEPGQAAPKAETRDEEEFLREIESLIVDETDDGFPGPDDVFRIDPTGGEVRLVIAEARDPEEPPPVEDSGGEHADEEGEAAVVDESATGEEPPKESAVEPAGEPAASAEDDEGAPEEQEPPAGDEPEPLPLPAEAPPRDRRPRLVLLAVVALVVGAAWTHSERGRLLRHPAGQALLGPVYGVLGIEASPAWSTSELTVIRSSAVADPDDPGSLRVTAEFRNAASFGQPYPVLRVTLEDRWGQKVQSRDFAPSEYREAHVAGRQMRPGERVQASVSLPDPGTRADGFRLDLCLEGRGRQLECSTESRP